MMVHRFRTFLDSTNLYYICNQEFRRTKNLEFAHFNKIVTNTDMYITVGNKENIAVDYGY